MGVKKSTVCTSAKSGRSLYTPASSAVAAPTSRLGSSVAGRRRSTCARAFCPSFDAQPAQLDRLVSFMISSRDIVRPPPFVGCGGGSVVQSARGDDRLASRHMPTPTDGAVPCFVDPADYVRARARLADADFTGRGITRRLEVATVPTANVLNHPLYLWRTRGGDALDTFIRLFLLYADVPTEAARVSLRPMELDAW